MVAVVRVSAVLVALALVLVGQGARAQDADETTNPKLIAALPASHVLIGSALAKVARAAVPVSAKFELDDHVRLSLSIYIASRGIADSRITTLKELSGRPLGDWSGTPRTPTRDQLTWNLWNRFRGTGPWNRRWGGAKKLVSIS